MRKITLILVGIIFLVLIVFIVPNTREKITPFIVSNIKSCSDTDGGTVYDIKGTVSWKTTMGENKKTDYCMNNGIIIEHRCIGNEMGSIQHRCDIYCLEGACITI